MDRRTSVLMRRLKDKDAVVAEVNDKGDVTVEGEFVGRIEGFRFRQDASSSPDAAKTLRQAATEALRPEFHLRADRFYNAPDTELDFTEQGGLMWGSSAVGKLIAGADAMKPLVEAFVDEDAGPEIVEKVRRRLQHFIDRKIAAQFEPLLAMSRDEALTGLARGFAFRLVEGLGVLPRETIAAEVKELDQDARGALRKHGVRFGQYTIFQPLLLKPAPTRLRLVLWSLAQGLSEFPESPPPGLVTIPNLAEVPRSHYALSGYHAAGARAIRIDMLERLADLLRARDSRAGFEAAPEMLSITGMTADQFADLMTGLGYQAKRGERVKQRAPVVAAPVPEVPVSTNPITEAESALPPEPEPAPAEAEPAAPELEVLYTYTWAQRPRGPRHQSAEKPAEGAAVEGDVAKRPSRHNRRGKPAAGAPEAAKAEGERPAPKPRGEGRPDRGPRPEGKGKPKFAGKPREDRGAISGAPPERSRSFEAHPPKKADRIDPDNPFAALLALRDKT